MRRYRAYACGVIWLTDCGVGGGWRRYGRLRQDHRTGRPRDLRRQPPTDRGERGSSKWPGAALRDHPHPGKELDHRPSQAHAGRTPSHAPPEDERGGSLEWGLAEMANPEQLNVHVKSLHFTRALASAGECAAALDQIEDECAAPGALLTKAREELRLCMLLTLGLRR